MILAIRTDKPEAELYLLDKNSNQIAKKIWQADRKLADSILSQIKDLLEKNKVAYHDISAVIIFTGQGSFTGLRIGTTVANTIAYSLKIPIVKSSGENWLRNGIDNLKESSTANFIIPDYDSEPNITKNN